MAAGAKSPSALAPFAHNWVGGDIHGLSAYAGTLYGYAVMKDSGKRLAFFQEGDDILVVEEGTEFLHNYRLIKVGPDSADVLELSSDRHANVPMTQPPPVGGGPGGGDNGGGPQ